MQGQTNHNFGVDIGSDTNLKKKDTNQTLTNTMRGLRVVLAIFLTIWDSRDFILYVSICGFDFHSPESYSANGTIGREPFQSTQNRHVLNAAQHTWV